MRLSGPCQCGNQHSVELSVDPEVDMDAVVQLSASIGADDTVKASDALMRELVAAGVVVCPNKQRKGDTLGYSNGYLTT